MGLPRGLPPGYVFQSAAADRVSSGVETVDSDRATIAALLAPAAVTSAAASQADVVSWVTRRRGHPRALRWGSNT